MRVLGFKCKIFECVSSKCYRIQIKEAIFVRFILDWTKALTCPFNQLSLLSGSRGFDIECIGLKGLFY